MTVNGIVTNGESNQPMDDVKVDVICWYYGNSPDQSYSGKYSEKVITNSKGEFKLSFEKGAFVEILIDKEGFKKLHETRYINNKLNTFKIELNPK